MSWNIYPSGDAGEVLMGFLCNPIQIKLLRGRHDSLYPQPHGAIHFKVYFQKWIGSLCCCYFERRRLNSVADIIALHSCM